MTRLLSEKSIKLLTTRCGRKYGSSSCCKAYKISEVGYDKERS